MTETERRMAENAIRRTAQNWNNGFVARTQIPEFTAGAYTADTMSNFDGAGKGPVGAFKIGRRVMYPIDSLVDWLIERITGMK